MGSRLLVCARPAAPGEVGHESESIGWSRTMEYEVIGRVALGGKFCGGVSEHDACMTGFPPYLDY